MDWVEYYITTTAPSLVFLLAYMHLTLVLVVCTNRAFAIRMARRVAIDLFLIYRIKVVEMTLARLRAGTFVDRVVVCVCALK